MSNWVLVSGAGTGIGKHISLKLARRGFNMILLGRRQEPLQETAIKMAKVKHHIIAADVRDAAAIREGLQQTGIKEMHAVIANAGVGGENHYGPDDRWDDIISTNLTGSYNLVMESLPYLREGDEEYHHIVFISSILARLGVPGYSAYCASKAGILGLMRSLAKQLAPDNILVNAICPGWVNTYMARQGIEGFAQHTGKSFDDAKAEQMQAVPLGKMSEPSEVAELVHFLLSRVQASITGQTLDINNGAEMP